MKFIVYYNHAEDEHAPDWLTCIVDAPDKDAALAAFKALGQWFSEVIIIPMPKDTPDPESELPDAWARRTIAAIVASATSQSLTMTEIKDQYAPLLVKYRAECDELTDKLWYAELASGQIVASAKALCHYVRTSYVLAPTLSKLVDNVEFATTLAAKSDIDLAELLEDKADADWLEDHEFHVDRVIGDPSTGAEPYWRWRHVADGPNNCFPSRRVAIRARRKACGS